MDQCLYLGGAEVGCLLQLIQEDLYFLLQLILVLLGGLIS